MRRFWRRFWPAVFMASALIMPVAGQARTSDTTPAAVAQSPEDAAAHARREVLARRYFAAVQLDVRMTEVLKSIMPMLTDSMRTDHPEMTDEEATAITDSATESMAGFTPKYLERVVSVYADAFSEDELTQIVAFYESPVGRSITAKSPALLPQINLILQDMMPGLKADMVTRLCGKIDCKGGKKHVSKGPGGHT